MKKKKKFLTEGLGWIGVLSILLAYALLIFDIVESQSLWYNGLNLLGGAGIIVDSIAVKNYPPAALNIVWILIALYAITRVAS